MPTFAAGQIARGAFDFTIRGQSAVRVGDSHREISDSHRETSKVVLRQHVLSRSNDLELHGQSGSMQTRTVIPSGLHPSGLHPMAGIWISDSRAIILGVRAFVSKETPTVAGWQANRPDLLCIQLVCCSESGGPSSRFTYGLTDRCILRT